MTNKKNQQNKIILGDEYDEKLRDILKNVLKELDGKIQLHDWGVGGSQEIETMEVDINELRIKIESETYIGLSITGENELVGRISSMVKKRMADYS